MRKIPSENWFSNYTYADRYYLTGIQQLVVDYTNREQTKQITIIDVGCSTAIALRQLQTVLENLNMPCFTIGIDSDKKVKNVAEKNVNHFINDDVTKINHVFEANIVICSKMALWVSAERRHQIILKCSEFLKDNGKLITDVDNYTKTGILEDLADICKYDFPPLRALKYGIRKFLADYRYQRHGHLRKKMKSFGKKEAVEYAWHILKMWQKLKWHEKLSIKFDILTNNITYRVFPKNPKQK
jgi:hypothetical protein